MRNLRSLVLALALGAFALSASLVDARGSFGGGGGHSFGGGGGHSFGGGGSFGGGSRSSGSSFGSRSGSFGSSSGSFSRSSSSGSSFSRSGSFGHSGSITSTTVRPGYASSRPLSTSSMYYNGGYHTANYYGGWSNYSYYWGTPMWYYYTPFHPAFYYGAPVYYNGMMYPGDFSWSHLFISIIVFIFIIWLIAKLFGRGGGGKKIKYTSYE